LSLCAYPGHLQLEFLLLVIFMNNVDNSSRFENGLSCRKFGKFQFLQLSLGKLSAFAYGSTMVSEENTAWFYNIEIGTCLIYPTEKRADTERPDGRIEGVDLNVLSEALCYVFYLWRSVIEFTKVGGFRSCSIGEMSSVSEIPGGGQSDVFVDRLNPSIRSSRYKQFGVYEFFHGEDYPVLHA